MIRSIEFQLFCVNLYSSTTLLLFNIDLFFQAPIGVNKYLIVTAVMFSHFSAPVSVGVDNLKSYLEADKSIVSFANCKDLGLHSWALQ
jgi:hypothetical protein